MLHRIEAPVRLAGGLSMRLNRGVTYCPAHGWHGNNARLVLLEQQLWLYTVTP